MKRFENRKAKQGDCFTKNRIRNIELYQGNLGTLLEWV